MIGIGFSIQSRGIQVAYDRAMQPTPVQLSVRNVRKSFAGKAGEVQVLDDLSFSINERDFVSIIGPSGCGKTTIFNIIAGLIEPDSGSLHYRGEEIESLRGRVGYMMQKDLLFPWRTVLGNVLLGLETRGVDRDEAESRVHEYLKDFGLAGFENAYPKTLSGGMRQRVALIRTLSLACGSPSPTLPAGGREKESAANNLF